MAGWNNSKYSKNTQKFNNHIVQSKDGKFDSKKEYRRWIILKGMEKRGEISNLQRQVTFELIPSQKLIVPRISPKGRRTLTELKVTYIADFVYYKNGIKVVEDSKGLRTPEYVIKRKLMLYIHGIQVAEV